jgi:hypothetical protein
MNPLSALFFNFITMISLYAPRFYVLQRYLTSSPMLTSLPARIMAPVPGIMPFDFSVTKLINFKEVSKSFPLLFTLSSSPAGVGIIALTSFGEKFFTHVAIAAATKGATSAAIWFLSERIHRWGMNRILASVGAAMSPNNELILPMPANNFRPLGGGQEPGISPIPRPMKVLRKGYNTVTGETVWF